MTESTHDPHARAIELNRQVLELQHQADSLKAKAAELRRTAKTAKLSSDAFAMRHEAKQNLAEASKRMAKAKKLETELIKALKESCTLLTKRLPPEYSAWGIQKTHAYVNLLKVLKRQVSRDESNTALATQAINALLSHTRWTEAAISGYSVLKPSARSLG